MNYQQEFEKLANDHQLFTSDINQDIYNAGGPPHRPIFNTDVQIPNSKKIIGSGTSKKNAQQNAASKLLQSLKII